MASAGAVPLPIRGFRIWEGSCADRQGSRLSSKKICRVISVAKALVSGSLASGSTDVFRSCKRVETRPLDDSGLTLGPAEQEGSGVLRGTRLWVKLWRGVLPSAEASPPDCYG
jgi:hypothetical protein